MNSKNKLLIVSVALFFVCGAACRPRVEGVPRPVGKILPPVILWAWERPEDLEFLDSNRFGIAFLAQTLSLQGDDVILSPRRQPLKVSPATILIAVTRIESQNSNGQKASLSAVQQERLVTLVERTKDLHNVAVIQIDFDAASSEREFYRGFLHDLRKKLPDRIGLSMTALASFCIGDRWLKDLPVDEAVPMIFRMGTDDIRIKNYLSGGNDFLEPLCQTSYGIAVDEPVAMKFDTARRLYVFNTRAWTEGDVRRVLEIDQR